MIRKFTAALAALLTLLTLAGCQDYVEYDDMAHISAIGIDYDKDKSEVTLTLQELPAVRGGSGGGNPVAESVNLTGAVHSATCTNIFDALSKIEQVVAKKPFHGYADVIVIGEGAACHMMEDIIELVDRTPSIRASTRVVVTENAGATIATKDATHLMSSGREISDLLDSGRYTGAVYSETLQDFEEMLAISGLEGTLPHILTVSNEEVQAKGGTGDEIRSDLERTGDAIACGTAVFKGARFVGYLDECESRGYGWLAGKDILSFKTSGNSNDGMKLDFFRISKSKTTVRVRFENSLPVIGVSVRVTSDLRKLAAGDAGRFILAGQVTALEKKLSDSIRADMEAALKKCQKEYNADIFGFGFAVFREDHRLWTGTLAQRWDEIFPNLKVELNVDARIINSGSNIRRFDIK